MNNWIIFILILTAIILPMYYWNHRKRTRYIKEKIINNWGKQTTEDYKDDDLISISSYFKNTKGSKSSFIDEITWNDLNMNEVFNRVNNTQSSVGEEVLYNTLREPLFDEGKLNQRDNIIEYFGCNEEDRVKVQYTIAKLGKDRRACMSDFFDNESETYPNLIYYKILSAVPIVSLGLLLFTKIGALLIVAVISVLLNAFIHLSDFKKNEDKLRRINYIVSLVHCAEGITKLDIEGIKKNFTEVETSINNLKSIKNKAFKLIDPDVINDLDVIADSVKMFFLLDVIKYEKIKRVIGENKDDLINIYEFVGTIDSCISVASYRKSLRYYAKPAFDDFNQTKHLSFKNIYHPLIQEPVSNSCEIDKSILITGSNASGKSTFLKTIAINSILGQTIYTCLASEYISSYFKIYTSMALKDDLTANESYYIVEIKSLKRIIENISDSIPCLCFVDEILRGTNTVERISASSEVLNFFANSNCLCISATHDVELTRILGKVFDNYHFQENISEGQITFDYKLYHGRTQTRNAIKLLSIMGYSKDIVLNAEQRAEDFISSGIWNEVEKAERKTS